MIWMLLLFVLVLVGEVLMLAWLLFPDPVREFRDWLLGRTPRDTAPVQFVQQLEWPEEAGTRHPEWEVCGVLGEGGLAHVFTVYDKNVGRWWAVKALKSAYASNSQIRLRFIDEPTLLSRVASAGCAPRVVDASAADAVQVWYAMELLHDFSTLRQWVDSNIRDGLRKVLAREAALLVATMHAQGVVHRDLCPKNIMVRCSADGEVAMRLIDFGSATLVGSDIGGVKLLHKTTMIGEFAGKFAYAAPEVVRRGMMASGFSGDVFSLAIVICEVLLGDVLPTNSIGCVDVSVQGIARIHGMLSRLQYVDSGLRETILACLGPAGTRPTASQLYQRFRGS